MDFVNELGLKCVGFLQDLQLANYNHELDVHVSKETTLVLVKRCDDLKLCACILREQPLVIDIMVGMLDSCQNAYILQGLLEVLTRLISCKRDLSGKLESIRSCDYFRENARMLCSDQSLLESLRKLCQKCPESTFNKARFAMHARVATKCLSVLICLSHGLGKDTTSTISPLLGEIVRNVLSCLQVATHRELGFKVVELGLLVGSDSTIDVISALPRSRSRQGMLECILML
eukprot:CAMPEP_0203755420 /NCGR_PEP_ID=MMETSP0098-20131031/8877_1 /ASSEMBLY_ACC=CAM_ASM_000208 /TAXON_ID=96639 /ORGANISM=" , Strain NY0313808BC1" /LENGTH=231 /DNA_ID=CAMNT_0050646873 /DNA_START=68 /DNA_END=760 /DNA_ORIENTATION=-